MTVLDTMLESAAASASTFADLSLLLLGAGLLIGLYHALEPDHITAMMVLARRQKTDTISGTSKARASLDGSFYGMLWGFGHTTAVFLIVLAVFVFSLSIPQYLFGVFEVLVGVMLVVLGLSVMLTGRGILPRFGLHVHPHSHKDGTIHTHTHNHNDKGHGGEHHRAGHRPYFVGCLHGMAGSGGLVILAAAAASIAAASAPASANALHAHLMFATVFGAGSIIGMSAVAALLSVMFVMLSNTDTAKKIIQYASGVAAVAFGIYIIAASTAAIYTTL